MIIRATSVLALVGCLAMSGCTIYAPHQIASSNRPTTGAGSGSTVVSGESCQQYIIGIPIDDGNTARAALDAAKRRGGTETLTDITVDHRLFVAPFYAKACTLVNGVPVR